MLNCDAIKQKVWSWDSTFLVFYIAGLTIFVSPERSSERDYVITDSVRSMYVVCM